MEKHIYKLLAVIFILQVLVSLNGCALDAVENTSWSEDMYRFCSFSNGCQIVVDSEGNHLTDYSFDEKGNIVSSLDGEVAVLEAAVEDYYGSTFGETVEIVTDDRPGDGYEAESVMVIPEALQQDLAVQSDSPVAYTVIPAVSDYIDTAPVAIHKHAFETTVEAPTCTEPGYRNYRCVGCEYEYTEEIPVAGHRYNLLGTCTKCGYSVSLIKNHTHAYDSSVITEQPEYTAERTKTEEIPALDRCIESGTYSNDDQRTDRHEHTWDSGRTSTEPTCITEGEKIYTCKTCGETKMEVIPALDHCIENGTCLRCGQSIGRHEHTWNSGRTSIEPSCTKDGEKGYTCTTCGSMKFEAVPALGHSYANGVCTICGEADETTHVHTWDEGSLRIRATCQLEGVMVYTCTSCGEKETVTSAKEPHTYHYGVCRYCGIRYGEHEHEYVLEESVDSTCTTDGYDYSVCKYCGATKREWKNAAHKFDDNGICTVCGFSDDDKFTVYGRQLRNSGMSDYDKMMAVANFVTENGYGACTGYAGQCIRCATEAGLRCEFRTTQHVDCIYGQSHDFAVINAKGGYCECGLGDNHNWNRFYIGNDYYEFDLSSYGAYCKGPNVFLFGSEEPVDPQEVVPEPKIIIIGDWQPIF